MSVLLDQLIALVGTSILLFCVLVLFGLVFRYFFLWLFKDKMDTAALMRLGYFGYFSAFPLGIAAIFMGYLAGGTEEAAISAMIPGLLSLISGAAFLVFHKEIRLALPVGITIIAFSVNLFAGTTYGQIARELQEARLEAEALSPAATDTALRRVRQEARLEQERLFLEAEVEVLVRQYRAARGLDPVPESPPSESE